MKEYIIKVGDKPDIEGNYPLEEKPKELIRCKDCKYGELELWDNGECVDKTVYCEKHGFNELDWFCADAERKDDG